MCGRYKLSRRKQLVEEYFDCPSDEPDWNPRYNIAPHPADPSYPPSQRWEGISENRQPFAF